jgi:hypothetical protein
MAQTVVLVAAALGREQEGLETPHPHLRLKVATAEMVFLPMVIAEAVVAVLVLLEETVQQQQGVMAVTARRLQLLGYLLLMLAVAVVVCLPLPVLLLERAAVAAAGQVAQGYKMEQAEPQIQVVAVAAAVRLPQLLVEQAAPAL